MTLGTLAPALAALVAVFELLLFARRRASLPTRMDPGYDEAGVAAQRRGLTIVMIASVLVPILLWVVLNIFVPETGDIVLFQ